MFRQGNSCLRRFQQQFSYMEAQYPQTGYESISFSQMNNSQFSTCQNGFQNNQFHEYSETPCSGETCQDSSTFPGARFLETDVKESEVVDELLQILLECLKKADVRTQEILLRKFFFEIEKEIPLERFLVERLKHSKISFLLEKIPGFPQDSERFVGAESRNMEITTREIDVSTSKKLERFKVKTVQVGEIVKEEQAAR